MRWFALFLMTLIVSRPASSQPIVHPPPPVVLGSAEPDYLYPWTVQISGCRGTLVGAKWVLTAAHCITGPGTTAIMKRRDPSGQDQVQSRQSAPGGMIPFPAYATSPGPGNDLALIRLAVPFDILPSVQIAGLPADPGHPGTIGTVASNTHTGTLPAGKLAVFRAPLRAATLGYFEIKSTTASGSLCHGDSGSGFVTVENGRATVRGIASDVTVNDCTTAPNFLIDFADVFSHRAWILDTMRVTDYFLDGNTRIRAPGRLAKGTMMIACENVVHVSASGPLYVRGAQEGVNCGNDEQQTVVCSLDGGQPRLAIRSFTMRTMAEDGSVQTQSLSHSAHQATFNGLRPHGAYRQFECVVNDLFAIDVTDHAPQTRTVK